jgi:hypothetical protein
MFDYQLFIGFPKDPLFQKELQKTNEYLVKQYINGDSLVEIDHNGMQYLGKKLGKFAEFSKITLIENNIYSILKKLVPDFPYDETPLMLFTIPDTPHE